MQITEVLEKVRYDKIEFISLQFTDLQGVIKEVIIPSTALEGAINQGVWFDGSSIEGFARIQESDLFLKPDLDTYAQIPWLKENGKTARLICDTYSADGTPFEGDPRYILKKAVKEALDLGYEYNVGPEPEFYLFRREERTKPIDSSSYFDFASHEGYKVIREVMVFLKEFGIDVETSHHEVGKGQYEISFKYGKALDIADKLLTLKYTIKKVAQIHGLQATFMPKPIANAAGSGMHVHQSLSYSGSGRNAFFDENDKYNLSKAAYGFIGGQMKHIKSLCAVLCPTVNSYKRLVPGYEAPVYITWASMNRSALIRVPRWAHGKAGSARIELRNGDPSCNPYLAFAVMLKAGLDGVKNNLIPAAAVEENVYHLNNENLADKKIDTLPTSLLEALSEMRSSNVVREALGVVLFNRYVDIKTREWDEFKTQVTEWEIGKYLHIY